MTSFSSKANRLGLMAIKWMISSVAFAQVEFCARLLEQLRRDSSTAQH
jgi:hypothetical protein